MRQIIGLLRRRSGSGESDAAAVLAGVPVPDQFRQLMAAHYQALREYVPQPYPGRVTLFRAHTRPLFRLHGWDLGWTELAGGGLDVVPVPGNHETILKPPRVDALAAALRDRLRNAG